MLPPETAVLSVNIILTLKVILDANIISAAPTNPFIPMVMELLNSSTLSSLIFELQPAKTDKYPIPRIDDLFASLSGG